MSDEYRKYLNENPEAKLAYLIGYLQVMIDNELLQDGKDFRYILSDLVAEMKRGNK